MYKMEWWEILLIVLGVVIFLGIIVYIFNRRRVTTDTTGTTRISPKYVRDLVDENKKLEETLKLIRKGRIAFAAGQKVANERVKLTEEAMNLIRNNGYLEAQFKAGEFGETKFKPRVTEYSCFSRTQNYSN